MDNEIDGFERKRAVNLVWSAAGRSDFEPPVLMYDHEGKADLYWNSVIGSVYKHMEWPMLQAFYESFAGRKYQVEKENIFWIALQHVCYEVEAAQRPVFPYLRKEYIIRTLADMNLEKAYLNKDDSLSFRILLGYLQQEAEELEKAAQNKAAEGKAEKNNADKDAGAMFQGIDQVRSLLHADTREKRIIDAVRMPAEVSTPEVIRRLEEIFDQYFPGKKRQSWMMKWKKQNHQRHMLFADAEHSFERKKNAEDVDVHMHGAGAAEENFRKYLSNYFGKPLYDLAETRQIEQELCSGADTGCHLFYTDGEYADVMEKGSFIVTNDRSAEKYEGSNKEAYERNMDVYHHVINQLTARIRNSVLVHLEEQTVRATKGRIDVKRIWRGLYLDESRIFEKKLPGDHGNITVDILLDASDSQTPRRETIAAQGYILAESLTRCHIPVRIVSFCSLHGFTVMTKYRDYDETDKNARIFRYFTGGCNRDGLGIRMLTRMIQESSAQHRLFIVVSDCKPQDGARMKDKTGTYIDYTGEAAVNATADSVRRAIAQGIRVMCIYTGEDAEVANAAKIFDRHFVRIHNLDRMAEAVGNLLQSVISSMDV